jgi:hypothetical protein
VPSSTFSIRPMDELDSVGIDVAVDDVLFNLVTKDTQLMRGSTPWRGGRKKDPVLLQLLIQSTTHVGDIVLQGHSRAPHCGHCDRRLEEAAN